MSNKGASKHSSLKGRRRCLINSEEVSYPWSEVKGTSSVYRTIMSAVGGRPKSGVTYDQVVKITTCSPAQRMKADIQLVVEWMCKTSELFADMDKDIVSNVVKYCKCQIMSKDTIVVKQGEKGNAFYIILHGQVSIFVKEEDKPQPKKDLLQKLLATESDEDDGAETASAAESEVEEEEVKQPTAVKKSLKSKFKKVLPMLRMGRKSTKTVEKQKPDPRLGLGTQVVQLKAGKTFGELALLRKDNKRAASVVTDADAIFLVVERELYNKSIKSFQTREMKKIRELVDSHPFFSHWPARLQALVHASMGKVKADIGQAVVRQAEPCDGLHFLYEGEITVVLNSQLHQQILRQPDDSNQSDTHTDRDISVDNHDIMRKLSSEPIQIRRREGYAAAELYQHNRHRTLCVTTPVHVIGDVEHVLGLDTYIQTIKTSTAATVYHLSKENLTRILKQASVYGHLLVDNTLDVMRDAAYEKWKNRLANFTDSTMDTEGIVGLISKLEREETVSEEPVPLSNRREKFFQHLLKAYLNGNVPLIQPMVEGSHYYRMLIQQKASQRQLRRARGSLERPQPRTRLLANQQPRSIVQLKQAIRQQKTSDCDVIVPRRSSAPNQIREKPNKTERTRADNPDSDINTDSLRNEGGYAEEASNDNNEGVSGAMPILVTEKVPDADCTGQAATKSPISFFNRRLQLQLERAYKRNTVNPLVTRANQQAELIESKLQGFYEPNHVSARSKPIVTPLKRINKAASLNNHQQVP